VRYFTLVIIMDSYGQQLVTEHHEIVRAIRSGNARLRVSVPQSMSPKR